MRRHVLLALALCALVLAAAAAAARLAIDPGTLDVHERTFDAPIVVEADVNIVPAAINVGTCGGDSSSDDDDSSSDDDSGAAGGCAPGGGNGGPIDVELRLPHGLVLAEVDQASLYLCRGVSTWCADTGIRPLSVQVLPGHILLRFDRAAMIALAGPVTPPATVVYSLTGIVKRPSATFHGRDALDLLPAATGGGGGDDDDSSDDDSSED